MKAIKEYKNAALNDLEDRWAPAILATAIYCLAVVIYSFSPTVAQYLIPQYSKYILIGAFVYCLLFLWPFMVGFYNAFKELAASGDEKVTANVFRIGFSQWGKTTLSMLIVGALEIIGFLVLIVPGFILALMYSLVPYIIKDKPEISIIDALTLSRKMMIGRKWKLFLLILSFIGWGLLAILTLGIGMLWLSPYMFTTLAEFYLDAKADYEIE